MLRDMSRGANSLVLTYDIRKSVEASSKTEDRDQSALTAPRIFRAQSDGRGTGSVLGRPEVLLGVASPLSSCTKYPSNPSDPMKAHGRSTRESTSESTALELVKAH